MAWGPRRFYLLVGCLFLVVATALLWSGKILFPGDYLAWSYPYLGYPEFAALGPFVPNKDLQDITFFNYPFWVFMSEAISQGEFPLWNPLEGAGLSTSSLHAAGLYFPLHWLSYGLLPPVAAVHLELTVQYLCASLASFTLFRRWSGSDRAATLGALAYTLGGWHGAYFQQAPPAWPTALFPFILLGLDEMERKHRRGAVMVAVGVAGTILAGHLQMILASAVLIGVSLLVRKLTGKGWMFLALTSGVLLAAPHLGSLIELILVSDREQREVDAVVQGLLAPREYLRLLFPDILGGPSDHFYLGRSLASRVINTREHCMYAGQLTILLALLATYRGRSERTVKLTAGLTALGFLLAGAPWLYKMSMMVLPPLRYLTPLRFLPFVVFGVAYLASLGWSSYEKQGLDSKEKGLLAGFIGVICAGVLSFAVPATRQSPDLTRWLVDLAKDGIPRPPYFEGEFGQLILRQMLDHLSLTSPAVWVPFLLLAGLLVMNAVPQTGPRFAVALVVLLTDLGLFFAANNVPVPKSVFYPALPEIQALMPGHQMKGGVPTRVLGRGRGLHPNVLLAHGIANFESYESIQPAVYRRLFRPLNRERPLPHQLASTTTDRWFTPGLLDLFGISTLYDHPDEYERAEKDKKLDISAPRNTVLRAFLCDAWKLEPDLMAIYAPDFEPRDGVLLEVEPSFPSATLEERGFSPLKPSYYGYNEVHFQVKTSKPCLLVLNDLDYPGWSATVNARPVRILRAYGFARAIELPGGECEVRFRFRPTGWGASLGLALLGLIMLVAVAVALGRSST